MAEENLHMDDAFKHMAEDFKVNYDSSFWDEAAAKLNDASLDEAFRAAAQNVVVSPALPNTGNVDDVFMDAAFSTAAADQAVSYNPDFYKQFQESEASLQMDDAFQTAAASTVVDYLPNYWNDADAALEAEGLHYEYNSAYWAEAKQLLDKSDRAGFFTKWTSIAGLLLLISFSAQFIGISTTENGIKNLTQDKAMSKLIVSDEVTPNNTDDLNNGQIAEANEVNAVNNDGVDFTNELNPEVLAENVDLNHENNGIVESPNGLIENNGNPILTNGNQNLIQVENQNRNLVNANPIELKAPLFSQDENHLLSFNYKANKVNSSISALDKAIISNISNEDLMMPNLEINKGQDKPRGMHSFSVLANAGVGNNWAEEVLSPSLRLSLGAGYNYSPAGLLRNFDFGTNLQFNHVSQNNLGVEKRSSVYETHGGVTKYWYKLQLENMIYANTNFTVGYRLGAKSKINVGIGLDYLLAVGSNMSFKDKDFKPITTVNDNWGVKDGINLLDVKVGIGYEYLLNHKLALTLNANYGLLDRTDDEFLNQVKMDKEMNVMVGIKYTLFRKI